MFDARGEPRTDCTPVLRGLSIVLSATPSTSPPAIAATAVRLLSMNDEGVAFGTVAGTAAWSCSTENSASNRRTRSSGLSPMALASAQAHARQSDAGPRKRLEVG